MRFDNIICQREMQRCTVIYIGNGEKSMNTKLTGYMGAAVVAGGMLLTSLPVSAYEAGDIVLRAGVAGVLPTGQSEKITAIAPGARVEADDAWSLGLTGTYMFTDNIGVGVLAAWPFEHDIDAKGSISSLNKVGETKHLPPTVTLQYHFETGTKFHPYVGAGINYTYFFDEDTSGALSGLDLNLSHSWGLAGEVGLDYDLGNDWLISGQVWYINIDTEARLEGVGTFDVEIDPWVVMLGVGKKF
jgi:outer membrane protein